MANDQTGERTEKPTYRRLRDARERGQVARSRDLAPAASLAAVTLALGWFGTQMITLVAAHMSSALSSLADHARGGVEAVGLTTQLTAEAAVLARVAGPAALVAAIAAVAAGVAQVGWGFSGRALEMNWARLNPAAGFARFKPLQAGPELLKALIGLVAVGSVAYVLVLPWFEEAPGLMGMTPIEAAHVAWAHLWTLVWRASLALLVLGVADYAWQRWRLLQDLKMTRQEVREEARQNEGSPEIKSRVRRAQREMARSRMLKAVETATVVVTNPTHYAVALEYRRTEMAAPVVVAKGHDHMAARIRTVAREHGVPIVENVTLARALYKAADIGDTIPADLFGAVAEVLAYLVRLKQLIL
jgi:flagellar biosynthetic protein FlhB